MMKTVSFLVYLLNFASYSFANVEKTIFSAPAAVSMPNDASIDNLYLISLNPNHLTVRSRLNASFPSDESPKGSVTWMLLEGLTPGTRYEVRICWLATQPTAFSLYTHSISNTFETPELMKSLSMFAYTRQAYVDAAGVESLVARRSKPSSLSASVEASMLFLQIYAAADYFTLNEALMETVPPVLVDVILDPYILNVFPKSLIPTAGYIFALAVLAWFLSGFIWKGLVKVANSGLESRQKKEI